MIITRTPLRVSFVGGGTDLPAFYEREPGAVVSTAIAHYVYVFAHPFFSDHIQLKYAQTETVSRIDEIQMPVFREALRMYDIRGRIELGIVADLPKEGGSGLGGSTAFSVGLLNALSRYTGRPLSNFELAEQACRLELTILGNPIGKQDQFASAMGGLNYIQFNPDGTVLVEPIILNARTRADLHSHLTLFYTGLTRDARGILGEQQRHLADDEEKFQAHVRMRDHARELRDLLRRNSIRDLGRLLHENWLLKRNLASGISCARIDAWYARALAAGAEGGKLLGAGGGGFLLLYCRPERQDRLRAALGDLREMKFEMDPQGTRLILDESREVDA
jgi:D-glycero-alpha-D-manno-heptose-7-phosphate kinase